MIDENLIKAVAKKYIDDGFDDYISKPMEKSEIERILIFLKRKNIHIFYLALHICI